MPHSRSRLRPTTMSPLRRLMKRRRRRVVVERKLRRLQRIVPGGHGAHSDRLFVLTAQYILHLRLQLNLLHALSKIYLPHF
ncbi:hypothetical protein vseg_002147 [Gypsophila vaccaria]